MTASAMSSFWCWSALPFRMAMRMRSGWADALRLFVQEAWAARFLGLVLGWLVFRVMRRIDDYCAGGADHAGAGLWRL